MRNVTIHAPSSKKGDGPGNRLSRTGLCLAGAGLALMAVALGQVVLPLLEHAVVTITPALVGVETVTGAALTAAGFVCMVTGAAALEDSRPDRDDQIASGQPAGETPADPPPEQLTHPG